MAGFGYSAQAVACHWQGPAVAPRRQKAEASRSAVVQKRRLSPGAHRHAPEMAAGLLPGWVGSCLCWAAGLSMPASLVVVDFVLEKKAAAARPCPQATADCFVLQAGASQVRSAAGQAGLVTDPVAARQPGLHARHPMKYEVWHGSTYQQARPLLHITIVMIVFWYPAPKVHVGRNTAEAAAGAADLAGEVGQPLATAALS